MALTYGADDEFSHEDLINITFRGCHSPIFRKKGGICVLPTEISCRLDIEKFSGNFFCPGSLLGLLSPDFIDFFALAYNEVRFYRLRSLTTKSC